MNISKTDFNIFLPFKASIATVVIVTESHDAFHLNLKMFTSFYWAVCQPAKNFILLEDILT